MASSADARMTAEREEIKFLLGHSTAAELARAVGERLTPHRFRGQDANVLPGAQHYVTTVYFDTDDRAVYRDAAANEINEKLRAKEYYDLHPDLTELATDPRQLVRYTSVLWLELKRRNGSHSEKHRVGIPKMEVREFFASGVVTPAILEIQRQTYGTDADVVIGELQRFCAGLGSPLRADCLVNYRRSAWQDEPGTIRITIDRSMAYFRPPADLWSREHALVRETLGPIVVEDEDFVAEVKLRGAIPRWLVETLDATGARRVPHSKFLAASRAIHG